MENEQKTRLQQIENRIEILKKEIRELEEEKKELLNSSEILNSLPIRVRNTLANMDVKNDVHLDMFLNGDMSFMRESIRRFYNIDFIPPNQRTIERRLLLLRNVGKKNVSDTVKILKEKGLYKEI